MLYLDKILSQLAYPLGLSLGRGADRVWHAARELQQVLRWLPDAQALADSTRELKEYLGLWVYRWRGWA